jgi:hypothetical protein
MPVKFSTRLQDKKKATTSSQQVRSLFDHVLDSLQAEETLVAKRKFLLHLTCIKDKEERGE